MNVVFLSPEFPSHYYRFCVRLREAGATVLGLGQTPRESLRGELRDSLHEYYQVPDLHRFDELVRALGYFTWRHGKLDRIDSHNEHWLETEARLRDDFNIDGLRAADLPSAKQKSRMKEVFRQAGVRVARGHRFRDAAAARAFAGETGFPLVAKPDTGVGANATYVLAACEDLERFLAGSPEAYFLEEFVPGIIQTFDGLADGNGRPVFCASMEYSGVLDMVRDEIDTSYHTLREIPDDLLEAGLATLKAFRVRGRFFHIEYFRTPDGHLVALEVNLRPPGGLTIDMFDFASDVDLYRLWAEVALGRRPDPVGARPYHCGYAGRKSHKRYAHGHDEVLARCGARLVAHLPMDPVFHGAMGDYAYLLRSPLLEGIRELTRFILEKQ